MQNEATGDIDRSNLNKHCTEQELSLQREILQPGHRNTLRLSSWGAPAQQNHSVILQQKQGHITVKQTWDKDHGNNSVFYKMPSAMLQTTQAIRNTCQAYA